MLTDAQIDNVCRWIGKAVVIGLLLAYRQHWHEQQKQIPEPAAIVQTQDLDKNQEFVNRLKEATNNELYR